MLHSKDGQLIQRGDVVSLQFRVMDMGEDTLDLQALDVVDDGARVDPNHPDEAPGLALEDVPAKVVKLEFKPARHMQPEPGAGEVRGDDTHQLDAAKARTTVPGTKPIKVRALNANNPKGLGR